MVRSEIISLGAAEPLYNIRKRFAGTRAVETASDEEELLVLHGQAELGLLGLDWWTFDKEVKVPRKGSGALLGVVADGDLTVKKSILNWESDYGPFLYVRGRLRA